MLVFSPMESESRYRKIDERIIMKTVIITCCLSVFFTAFNALYSATQDERIKALEGVALYIPSDNLPENPEDEEDIPTPSDVKRRFNISDSQLLQDIMLMTQRYSKCETNEEKRLCRSYAVLWLGGYGTTNNLSYLYSIMHDNTDYAQENALFAVIHLTKKSDSFFPMLHNVMTNRAVFAESLRTSVYVHLHAWSNKKYSRRYIDDPVFQARNAEFFLKRAALEDDCMLYVDRVACELNPSYRHSQQRRDNLAKLRPAGLTGEQAEIYDARQRDALPNEDK